MSDLFVRLMRYAGANEEDFFTECLASTLREDHQLARDFLALLCRQELSGYALAGARISIETQVAFPGSCVGMVLHVNGDKSVGVENKLLSPEGSEQLSRYLDLGLDRLALIAGREHDVNDLVFYDPRYLKPPSGRKHFLWSDFRELVERSLGNPSATVLNKALLGLMADQREGFPRRDPYLCKFCYDERAQRGRLPTEDRWYGRLQEPATRFPLYGPYLCKFCYDERVKRGQITFG